MCMHVFTEYYSTWNQITQEAHPSIFIANVNCGASKENEICRSSQITTYPTLRYYLDGTEYDYTGSLSLEALREFIDLTVVKQCNPILDATDCSVKARKYAEKWNTKTAAQIKGEIERLGKMLSESEVTTTSDLRMWMRQRRNILKILHQDKMKRETEEAIQNGKSSEL